jgi:hypothetical protein
MKIRRTTLCEQKMCSIADADPGDTYWAPDDHGAVAVTKLDPSGFNTSGYHHVVWLFPSRAVYQRLKDFEAKGIMVTEFADDETLTLTR